MTLDRRAFLLSGLALAPPLAAAAPATRRVGYFSNSGDARPLAARLASLGWSGGRNLEVKGVAAPGEHESANHEPAARELLAWGPEVVVSLRRSRVATLARLAPELPIVAGLHDPVLEGFARSLARPGGRITGLTFSGPEGMKLALRLFASSVPGMRRIHALATGDFHGIPTVVETRRAVAAERGIVFEEHAIGAYPDAVRVLDSIRSPRSEGLLLGMLPEFDFADFGARVVRARIPAVDTGGRMEQGSLLSAGLVHPDFWGRLAAIVDLVLRGADPARIPFEQPMHAEVELNRRTAAAIGIAFPQEVLMRATRIID